MLPTQIHRASLFVAIACMSSSLAHAVPPSTSFTYQGRLTDTGAPVAGPVSATFRLFDSEVGGVQIGADILRSITPSEGLFSESLDFGAASWADNQARWLEIEIDGSILGRQLLEATPFALNTRGITVTADERVGLGTTSPNRPLELHANHYGFAHVDPFSGNDISTYVDGSGGWLGTFANTPLLFFAADSGVRMALDTNGRLAIADGVISPLAQLDVRNADADGTTILVDQSGSGITFGVDSTVLSGFGVRGTATNTDGTNYGVYGEAQGVNSWGVFSNGRIGATGTKSFAIDHPLNPEEWILLHYSSEAPEPLNTYSGTVFLDHAGRATVTLPDYYASINTDERYQLTAIGAPAPNLYIASKVEGARFTIAGGPPGLEVSWEVTARRNDRFVQRRGAPTEVQKTDDLRGRYLAPELYTDDRP